MIILECNSNPDGAYSYWRGKRPNIQLEKYGHRFITEADAHDLNYDAVFISEPSTPHSYNLLRTTKNGWIDIGDYCIDLPAYNPAYLRYKNGGEYWFLRCLEKANLVTVTTRFIKEKLSAYHDNIHVIPNAIMPNEIGGVGRNNLVYHRGSSHHSHDMSQFIFPEIDIPYVFAGAPHPTEDHIFLEAIDYKKHFWRMQHISPKYAVFPLVDNHFNRAKSNIMFLESTMCGAILLAPDWEEWRCDGITNFDTELSYMDLPIHKLLGLSENERIQKWEGSKQSVLSHFNLNTITQQRLELIEKFLVS